MGVVCLSFGFCEAEQSVLGEPLATQVCRDIHLCVDSAEAWGADGLRRVPCPLGFGVPSS